jgi:hypothetical protein
LEYYQQHLDLKDFYLDKILIKTYSY